MHVLLSAGFLTIWQVLQPAFMQLLQDTPTALACQALDMLFQQGRRLRDAIKELSSMLAELQAEAASGVPAATDDNEGLRDDEGRLFKVWL